MEKTFIICKPDAMQKRLVGTVISRFEAAGFDVIACKMARLSPALLGRLRALPPSRFILRSTFHELAPGRLWPAGDKYRPARA